MAGAVGGDAQKTSLNWGGATSGKKYGRINDEQGWWKNRDFR